MMWGPSVLYSLRFIAFTLFFIYFALYFALFSIFYLISPLLCTFVHYLTPTRPSGKRVTSSERVVHWRSILSSRCLKIWTAYFGKICSLLFSSPTRWFLLQIKGYYIHLIINICTTFYSYNKSVCVYSS